MSDQTCHAIARLPDLPLEADRFEERPHPREMLHCFGHQRPQRALLDAFSSGSMHHAWIFTGAEGIGKATQAYRFARYVMAENARAAGAEPDDIMSDPSLATNRQIAAMSNPGIFTVRRIWNEKTKKLSTVIPVDEVRRIRGFLQHTSAQGAWRIIIVDRADDLNISAANALLKSLEEPPENCLFLLMSSDPGRLLPTIRSRCRTLEFTPLDQAALDKAVRSVMAAEGDPAASIEPRLLALAEGRVRRYLALASGDGIKYYDALLDLISAMPKFDENKLLKISDQLSAPAAIQSFEVFYDLFFSLLARIIRAAATGEGLFENEREPCSRIVNDTALAHWAGLWETIAADKAEVVRLNLDRKSFVLETFYRMQTLTRRAA